MSELSKTTPLTAWQGYRAMLRFLETYHDRVQVEELAILLGGLTIDRNDGEPKGASAWSDWSDAIR